MAKSTKSSDGTPKPAAKPRKTTARKTAYILQMESPKPSAESTKFDLQAAKPVSHQQVAELAHRFWDERGRVHGHDAEDWYRAEDSLRGKAS